jgi:hypothetical protein
MSISSSLELSRVCQLASVAKFRTLPQDQEAEHEKMAKYFLAPAKKAVWQTSFPKCSNLIYHLPGASQLTSWQNAKPFWPCVYDDVSSAVIGIIVNKSEAATLWHLTQFMELVRSNINVLYMPRPRLSICLSQSLCEINSCELTST